MDEGGVWGFGIAIEGERTGKEEKRERRKGCRLLEGDGEGGGGFWEKGLGRVGCVDLKGRRQSWILSTYNLASVVFHLLAKSICWLSECPLSATLMG